MSRHWLGMSLLSTSWECTAARVARTVRTEYSKRMLMVLLVIGLLELNLVLL